MIVKPFTAKTILVAASIIYGLALVPCAFLALMTAMLADGNPPAWLFNMIFLGSLAVPASMLVAVVLGRVSYRRRSYLWAVLLTALPILTGIIPAIGVVILDGTN